MPSCNSPRSGMDLELIETTIIFFKTIIKAIENDKTMYFKSTLFCFCWDCIQIKSYNISHQLKIGRLMST